MKKDLDSYILTKQELLIMKIIWERGNATVRDVYNALSRRKPKAYTNILTLMQILEKKGVLSRKREGNSHLYSPILSKCQATINQVKYLLYNFYEGNPNMLIEDVLKTELHIIVSKAFLQKNGKMASRSAFI